MVHSSMKTNKGLTALTVESERSEFRCVGKQPIKLQYLKKSKQMMGQAFWNVLSPVPGYKSGGVNGFPTFGLQTLKDKGLI